jgi:hypothetical protein
MGVLVVDLEGVVEVGVADLEVGVEDLEVGVVDVEGGVGEVGVEVLGAVVAFTDQKLIRMVKLSENLFMIALRRRRGLVRGL